MQLSDIPLYYIYPMRQPPSRFSDQINLSPYRHSISVLQSDVIRNSIGSQPFRSFNNRESLGINNRFRNSLNLEGTEQILWDVQLDRQEKQKAVYTNLKSTLNDLQKKINKAKSQLKTYKNIIFQEDSDLDIHVNRNNNSKTPGKLLQTATNGSSNSKLATIKINKRQDSPTTNQQLQGYYLSHLMGAIEDSDNRTLEHLQMSLRVLKNYHRMNSPSFADIQERKVNLVRCKSDIGKKSLIVDIDQTLIHCQQDPSKPYDIMIPIQVQNGSIAQAYISIRPYAISFLKRMSKNFQIIAFTASHQSYADVVLDELDPNRQFIKHRLYRKNCIQIHENIYAKDLRIINRQLSNMVLIDNAPYSYIFQLQNGIPILPYYTGEDNELQMLEKYLQKIAKCSDVREVNKSTFKLHNYCNYDEPNDLVRQLYLDL